MKRALFAGLCALAITGCEASEEPSESSAAARTTQPATQAQAAPVPAVTQPAPALANPAVARVAGVPTNMLVSSPRAVAKARFWAMRTSSNCWSETRLNRSMTNTGGLFPARRSAPRPAGEPHRNRVLFVLKRWSCASLGRRGATGTQLCYRVLALGNARYRFSGIGVDSFDVVISRGNPQRL